MDFTEKGPPLFVYHTDDHMNNAIILEFYINTYKVGIYKLTFQSHAEAIVKVNVWMMKLLQQ